MSLSSRIFSVVAMAVVLLQVAPARASDTITLPFRARGVVVSQSVGPGGMLQIEARGRATQLGRYTAYVTLMVVPGQPPTFSGVVTMVAANGDALYLTNFGIVTEPPPVPGGDGGFEIIGGTGRFAGAGGQGAFSSHAGVTHFLGTITIPRGN